MLLVDSSVRTKLSTCSVHTSDGITLQSVNVNKVANFYRCCITIGQAQHGVMQTQKVRTAWDTHTARRVIKQKYRVAWGNHTARRVIVIT
jgi:hypothetical protein